MALPFGIQRSTLAGGITGVLAWGIGLGLSALGVPVPPNVVSGAVAILVPVVVHFVPDAAKVDAEIENIATILPQTYSAPSDFPENRDITPTPNNIDR